MNFNKSYLCLNGVLYIPGFCRNLISVSFNNKSVIISRNGLKICTGNSENNLYVLRPLMHESLLNTEIFKIERSNLYGKIFLMMIPIYETLDLVTLTLTG